MRSLNFVDIQTHDGQKMPVRQGSGFLDYMRILTKALALSLAGCNPIENLQEPSNLSEKDCTGIKGKLEISYPAWQQKEKITNVTTGDCGKGQMFVINGKDGYNFSPDWQLQRFELIFPPLTAPSSPSGVILTDLNNDGQSDLVATSNDIKYYKGKGDCKFGEMRRIGLSTSDLSISKVKAVDINGDGRIDLVGTGSAIVGPSTRVLLQKNGDQWKETQVNVPPIQGGNFNAFAIELGTISGDTWLFGGADRPNAFAGKVNSTDSSVVFDSVVDVAAMINRVDPMGFLTSTDFTGDGKPDVYISGSGRSIMLDGASNWTKDIAQKRGVAGPLNAVVTWQGTVSDLNGDKKPDMVLLALEGSSINDGRPRKPRVLIDRGDGNFCEIPENAVSDKKLFAKWLACLPGNELICAAWDRYDESEEAPALITNGFKP